MKVWIHRVVDIAVALLFFAQWSTAANVDYAPQWTTNDTWHVDVSYRQGLTFSDTDDDHKYSSTNIDVCYLYRVTSVNSTTHETIICATNQESGCCWLLTFDTSNMVLRSVSGPGGNLRNPFKTTSCSDAWLFRREFASDLVLDFPCLPASSTNELRPISKGLQPTDPFSGSVQRKKIDTSDAFTQNLSFASNSVAVVMSRVDASQDDYRVTLIWEKGKKWWKSATVTCGTNIAISATLRE